MATKKCPKCGEENPAEAVMCWACYTPLSSGPVAGAPGALGGAGAAGLAGAGVAGRGPAGAAPMGADSEDAGEKKKIDPKMIGVVAFLVVGGVIAAVVNGAFSGGGGSDSEDRSGPTPAPGPNPGPGPGPAPDPGPGPSVGPSLSGGTAAPAEVKAPYTVATAPNSNYATGVVAIVPTDSNISSAQAGGLAKFAKDQFSRQGKWQRMQIAVFNNQEAAKVFTQYQKKRNGAPLNRAEYQALANSGVWTSVPAFYESVGKSEKVFAPAKAPTNWWASGG